MSVHYKFKSEKQFATVSFDGVHISVADLKKEISHQKNFGKCEFGLLIKNAQTDEEYNNDTALIAKNTSVIVSRVPLTVQQKRSWDRNESQQFVHSRDEASTSHPVDLSRIDGSENDKINAMMTQSSHDYNPSNYQKLRGGNQTGEVPPSYRCHKCHQQGHWIKNCPLTLNQESIEIKKSTGIPRSFMIPVEGPRAPGAMITPTGHYAVPAIDHQAYKEGKKERPPFSSDPEPIIKKPEIPDDLTCNYCKDLLTDAVLIPCCAGAFCDLCIRTHLVESETNECPVCNEKEISPGGLIPSRFLRNSVMRFINETGYARRQIYPPSKKNKDESIDIENTVESTFAVPQVPNEVVDIDAAVKSEETIPKTIPTTVEDETKLVDPVIPIEASEPVQAVIEEGHEVIIPPGTEEPLLPITKVTSEKEINNSDTITTKKDDYEETFEDDRRPRERPRVFNKDPQRDRGSERIVGTYRLINRRRSSSPRQRNDYPNQHGHMHMMNQTKEYQNMPPANSQRYPPNMHYEQDMRRPGERPGTPTIDEPHLHQQNQGNPPNMMPYPPGEERISQQQQQQQHQQQQPQPQQQQQQQGGYNQPPPSMPPHGNPLLPDPYGMNHGHRMPMYPHQPGPHYGPPRYDRPPYQQPGYRPSQPRGGYNGPPRPMRGMHHPGYRGIQPPPIGIPRNIHNGNPTGVIDDPLEAFERMLREKDERDRRLGKHRRRSRTRSRSRSYSRSRSRSFGRRSPRLSRSRSPPPKRRGSRSPLPSRRSRSPKRRSRDGSRSFSISRSRSYSRSQSPPRGAISRDRDRERERDRDRDLPPRYRSPVRSPPRFQRDRERERDRPRSREGYSTNYYSESKDYGYRDRDRERERDSTSTRERTGSRYSRNQTSQHSTIPSLMSSHPPPPLMSLGSQSTPTTTTTTTSPSTQLPSASSSSSTAPLPSTAVAATSVVPAAPERKDYYDSYNRYSGPPGQQQRFNSPTRGDYQKRFDDVAPPGTEGYYDVPPPGVDHPERLLRDERERPRSVQDDRDHKDADDDRPSRDDRPRDTRDREDRDRRDRDREREKDDRPLHQKEKDERDRRDVKDKEHDRYVRRDDDRTRDYDKDKDKYRDDRERGERDRYRNDDKIRIRERTDRKDRDFDDKERDRHDRHSDDRKKNKKSSSPHPQKTRSDTRDISPEKKKEKKLKDKKKKKDSVDEKLEKKKKKKKEKKSLKEAIAKNELSKYQSLQSSDNNTLSDKNDDKLLLSSLNDIKHENNDDKMNTGDVSTSHDESFDIGDQNNSLVESTIKNNDKTIISMMNPEPPEQTDDNNDDFCLNPPNPNFKPIPEVKNNTDKPTIDSLYEGLDDTEINTVITEKYAILPEEELTNVEKYNSNDDATKRIDDEDDEDDNDNDDGDDDDVVEGKSINTSAAIATTTIEPLTSTPTRITTSTPERNIATATATSIKTTTKDEFLAPMPELSKWERDERDEPDEPESDTAEEFIKLDVSITSPQHSDIINDELQSTKLVTSEVLKRAENAIFQKAINAIRPIEIKKISESRKVLYQNPEPKNIIDTNTDLNRSSSDRKSVNVTINVGKNERNVEITEPSLKKSKLDRSNYRSNNDLLLHSPTRLSAKERLGDKIDDDDGNKDDSKTLFYDKDINKSDNNLIGRSRSPKLNRKQSPIIDTISRHTTSERKVYLDDKKRDKNERQRDHRGHHSIDIKNDIKDTFIKREKNDNKDDSRSIKNTDKIDKEKRGKSPVYAKHNTVKRKIVGGGVGDDDDIDKKKDSKKNREDKKRKRSHRSNSRSKSKDCKRKKEKKHKDNKKQKHNKEHSSSVLREKLITNEKSTIEEKNKVQEDNNDDNIVGKKLNRKNPRLISDRKKSALDEASFEPDYSASETATDDNNDDNLMNIKKQKNNDDLIATDSVKDKIIDSKIINKKRIKSTSSDDDDEDSSTTLSSSSESDDSSYKKRKKKHKKHKKRKTTRKDSSSDSDSYSDSSESSSEDEKHKKKSKKSKSKSKQSKKKKKSKHK